MGETGVGIPKSIGRHVLDQGVWRAALLTMQLVAFMMFQLVALFAVQLFTVQWSNVPKLFKRILTHHDEYDSAQQSHATTT